MRALAAQAKDAEAQAIMMRLAGGFSGIGGGPFYGRSLSTAPRFERAQRPLSATQRLGRAAVGDDQLY